MRRRPWAVAAVAASAVLAVGGCGVQPTGVNIAQTEPFGASATSIPESASPSQYPYAVSLFLFSSINKGPGAMISRPVPTPPSSIDLPNQLAKLTGDEQLDEYTTYVPMGITLKPSTQVAHEYYLYSPSRVTQLALTQLTCTFDQWWIQHPDNHQPSTRFIVVGTGVDTGWLDCTDGVLPGSAVAAKPSGPVPGKPGSAG